MEVEEAGLLKRALAWCTAWQCRVVPKVPACDSESPSACCSESPSSCRSVSLSLSSVVTASPLAQGQHSVSGDPPGVSSRPSTELLTCRVVPKVLGAIAEADASTPPCLAMSDGELAKLLDEGER